MKIKKNYLKYPPKILLLLIFLLWKFIILGEKSMTSCQNTNNKINYIEGRYRGRIKCFVSTFFLMHFTCARDKLQNLTQCFLEIKAKTERKPVKRFLVSIRTFFFLKPLDDFFIIIKTWEELLTRVFIKSIMNSFLSSVS